MDENVWETWFEPDLHVLDPLCLFHDYLFPVLRGLRDLRDHVLLTQHEMVLLQIPHCQLHCLLLQTPTPLLKSAILEQRYRDFCVVLAICRDVS
jgi:hypothetical protein